VTFTKEKERRKRTGSFETPTELADFIVERLIELSAITRFQGPKISILDPAIGSGVLVERLLMGLGSSISSRWEVEIWGVDVDSSALQAASTRLERLERSMELNMTVRLLKGDFMEVAIGSKGGFFDLVIANPPFVRHHLIGKDKLRRWYQEIMRGFYLNSPLNFKSSSWSPFLLKSHFLLRQGASLAFILPRSFLYSNYSEGIRNILLQNYKELHIYIFSRYSMPSTGISPIVLLAIGRLEGNGGEKLYVNYLPSPGLRSNPNSSGNTSTLAVNNIPTSHWHAIPLIGLLKDLRHFIPFRTFAKISLGTVTGADKFFRINKEIKERFRIDDEYLMRCLPGGKQLKGLSYSLKDWSSDVEKGERAYLLRIDSREIEGRSLSNYIKWGEFMGFHKRYHTRKRKPWYTLSSHIPHAFLAYISGMAPKLSLNEGGVTSTNSVHHVDFGKGVGSREVKALIVSFYSTPSLSSAEVFGRPMGGGALKLELGGASKLLIPDLRKHHDLAPELLASWKKVDALLRENDLRAAIYLVDEILVSQEVISMRRLRELREALELVHKARTGRSILL